MYAGRSAVTGKPRYVSRHVHGTAGEADEALANLVAEVGTVDHTSSGETVGQLLDRWLTRTAVLKDLSPTTVREHRRTIDKTIKPVLGDVEARRLKPSDLDTFYAGLLSRERPLSRSSVRRVHAVMSAALAAAVKSGELSSNPALRASPPTQDSPQAVAPSVENVQALIVAADADDPDIGALIALAAVTGARRGELLGLRWSDWDRDRGTLTIQRSAAAVEGGIVFKPTKTRSIRRIAVDPFTDAVLTRHRSRMEERADDAGAELTDDLPIFTYDLVTPIHPDTVSHYVRVAADRAGLPDVHLHSLRHFAATQLIGGGTDVRTVAGRLGHANANTTLKVYSHALPERDREAAAVLGKALTPGGGS